MLAAFGCQPASKQPLSPAGSDRDDGHGLLARASSKMMTSNADEPGLFPARRAARVPDDDDAQYGGSAYGGDPYGGDGAFGGATYAAYVVPAWGYPSVNRQPPYVPKADLRGAIEGTISWRGAMPTLTTTCGVITPVRTGAKRTLAGAVVYLERVTTGRPLMHASGELRPATVGGVIVKRGCSFAPPVQIVTPIPAQLAINGDRKAARVSISLPQGGKRTTELQEGGRIAIAMKTGVLRVEGEDGTLGAAFALGLETPAYAITDETGAFRLDELAPGTYELVAWFAPLPSLVNGRLTYGEPLTVKRSVRVDGERTVHIDLALGTSK